MKFGGKKEEKGCPCYVAAPLDGKRESEREEGKEGRDNGKGWYVEMSVSYAVRPRKDQPRGGDMVMKRPDQ
ncbi:hypothetical protein TMatcc_006103 [Talaromyces marneffei ATCC 18224]